MLFLIIHIPDISRRKFPKEVTMVHQAEMKRANEVSVVREDIKESVKSWRQWCGSVSLKIKVVSCKRRY